MDMCELKWVKWGEFAQREVEVGLQEGRGRGRWR